MKIAHIIGGYRPPIGGGSTHVKLITDALIERGHEVYILSTQVHYYAHDPPHVIRFKRYPYSISPELIFHLTHRNYDIVHVHGYRSFQPTLASIAKLLKKFPLVFTPHYHPFGSHPYVLRRFFDVSFGKFSLSIPDKIVVLTPVELEFLRKYRNKIEIIPNPVHPGFFEKVKSVEKIDFKERYGLKENIVLYIGRIHKEKGLIFLVEAFQRVNRINPDTSLLIVGKDDGFKAELVDYIKRKNIRDVVFTGLVSQEDLLRAYSVSSVLVLPSSYEATGLVLLEAMAQRVPVIASNVGGIPYVLRECGTLVQYGDVDSLTKAISLIEDKNLRKTMINHGLKRINDFKLENVVRKLERMYYKVMV